MPFNGTLAAGTLFSALSCTASTIAIPAMSGNESAECSDTGRSVFERLGSRPTVSAAGLQMTSASDKANAQNETNSAMTEDEDGEMTGSTSDEEQQQGTKNSATSSRILSLRTVVGANSSTRTASRSGHRPIVYDEPLKEQQISRSGFPSSNEAVRSGSRTSRHGQYESSHVPEGEISSPCFERRRRRSSNTSAHYYDRQHSASLTPPHLRDSNGLRYDRHGNLRRTTATQSSSSPYPNSGSSNRPSHAYHHHNSPPESLSRSHTSPSSSTKREKYRQYFDDFRKSDRTAADDACSAFSQSSRRSVHSASHKDPLLDQEFESRKRHTSGNSRSSFKQNEPVPTSLKRQQNMTEKRRNEESEQVIESRTIAAVKTIPEEEVEEGEEFSDWSADNNDDDLDSISSSDDVLAHIFTSNNQNCPKRISSGSQNDQEDRTDCLHHGKSSLTSSTEQTDSWKRLPTTQPSIDRSSSNARTGKEGLVKGEAGAAAVLHSCSYSSKLAGPELIQELNEFVSKHGMKKDGEHLSQLNEADAECRLHEKN